MTARHGALTGTLIVGAAALCFGTVPFFARSLIDGGMPPVAVAFWRFALPGFLLLPFVWPHRHQRAALAWGMAAGLALGLGWVGYAAALRTLPVATAGVIYMTYPLFTALLGWVWFGYRPTGATVLAAGLVLVAALISSSAGPVSASDVPAMLLALTAPLGFAFGLGVLTIKLGALPVFARMGAIQIGTVIGLGPLVLASGAGSLIPAAVSGWWYVAGAALVTALIPQLIYTIYAPRIGATRTAIAGSIELPTMFLIGWLAFAETLAPGQWIACALILAALVLAQAQRAPAPS